MNQPAASTPATDTVPATSVLDTAPIVATHVIASSIAPTTGTVPVTSAPIILAPVIIPPVNHETVDSSSVTSNVSALNTIFGTPEQQAQDATTRLAQQASTPELSWWEQRDKDGYEYFTTDPKTWASSTGTSVFNTIFGTPAIIPTDVAVSATPARDITPVTQPAPVSTAVTAQVTSVIPPVAVAALGTTALSLGSTKKEATPTTNQAPQRSWSEFGTEMKNNAKTELAGYYNAAFTPEEQAAFEAAQQPKALQLKADQEKYVAEIKARDEAFNKEQDALAAQEKIDKDNKDEAIRKTNKETGTYLYNTIFGTPEYQAQQAAQQKAAQLQQATNWLIENNKFTDQQLSSMTPEQVINQYQTLKLEAIRKNKPTFSINAVSKIAPQQNTRSAIPKSAISPIIETPNFVLSVRPQTMLSALEAKPTFTPPSISTDPNNFSSSSETVD